MSGTREHYTGQLQQLLPPGKAFTREEGNLTDLLRGIAEELRRVDDRASDLADEQFTDTMEETVPDWERAYGLPDCDAPETLEGRQAAIAPRRFGIAAQDSAFYVEFAETIGADVYTDARVWTRPASPFTAGAYAGGALTNMGTHNGASLSALVKGAGWPYVWHLDVAFLDGEGAPTESTDELDLILECQVSRIAQDHTIVSHLYRLFASDADNLTCTHAAALDLFHPATGEELDTIAIDALPSLVLGGIEYLYAYDDGADPVDIEFTPIPEQMARGWFVSVIPTFDSDDTDDHTVFAFGDSGSVLELVPASATEMRFVLKQTITVDTIAGETVIAQSVPLTFSSSDALMVVLNGETGELTVYGASQSGDINEDAFTWDLTGSGALHIGKDA